MNFCLIDASMSEYIAKIEDECFGAEAWTKKMIEESLSSANTFFWGAFDEQNTLVAYTTILSADETCDLIKIAVSPQHRRKGIADALLKFVGGEVKKQGGKKIFLEVNAANIPAISLYAKNGFTVLFTRHNYYSGAQYGCKDALTMTAEL